MILHWIYPEDKRWAANITDKSRNIPPHREALCETLVLLAVHGTKLIPSALGINIEARVNAVIRDLLDLSTPRPGCHSIMICPRYAEAAPDVFLEILEQDLKAMIRSLLF